MGGGREGATLLRDNNAGEESEYKAALISQYPVASALVSKSKEVRGTGTVTLDD